MLASVCPVSLQKCVIVRTAASHHLSMWVFLYPLHIEYENAHFTSIVRTFLAAPHTNKGLFEGSDVIIRVRAFVKYEVAKMQEFGTTCAVKGTPKTGGSGLKARVRSDQSGRQTLAKNQPTSPVQDPTSPELKKGREQQTPRKVPHSRANPGADKEARDGNASDTHSRQD